MKLSSNKNLRVRIGLVIMAMAMAFSSTLAVAEGSIVVVTGSPDCDGILSNYCGWGDLGNPPPYQGESGGGGGGGGGGTSSGTTGKTMDFNRPDPSCQNEALAIEEAATQSPAAAIAEPLGDYVPLVINDPAFNNGEWEKRQTTHIQHTWSQATNETLVFKQVVHYMVNRTTGAIAQVKLKNSQEYGCKGIKQ